MKALSTLKKDDIVEMKSFPNPPEAVVTVMEAVCLLLGEDGGWDSAKRVLQRPNFIDELRVSIFQASTTLFDRLSPIPQSGGGWRLG